MQELKKMYIFHLAKSTRDTFTTEVLPVSNGDWKTFKIQEDKPSKKDPKRQESEPILVNKEEETLL